MSTVLITGGTGFLGRKLLAALLERGVVGDSEGKSMRICERPRRLCLMMIAS